MYAVVPPVALRLWVYVEPTKVEGRLVVVIETGAAMTRVKSWVVVCAPGVRLSVICTVKVEVPEVVGVPKVAPEDDKVRPSGKEPALIDQV